MTDVTPPEGSKRNPLMEEAATWFARMRGPDADSHKADFEAWLARGALHRAAYNRAGEIFSLGKFLAEDDARHGVSAADALGAGGARIDMGRRRPIASLATAGCILLLAGWALVARPWDESATGIATVADAGPGRPSLRLSNDGRVIRTVALADGSRLVLQPDTEIAVSLTRDRRMLQLEKGSARFEVAHEGRPFLVFAGGGAVRATGTAFDVTLAHDQRVMVRLIRGSVDVLVPRPRTGMPVARLRAGEILSYGVAPAPGPDDTGAQGLSLATAGSVRDLSSVRIGDLLAQANAVNSTTIRIAQPGLADRTVSGRFRIDEAPKLADQLAWMFDLKVDRNRPGEIVLSDR